MKIAVSTCVAVLLFSSFFAMSRFELVLSRAETSSIKASGVFDTCVGAAACGAACTPDVCHLVDVNKDGILDQIHECIVKTAGVAGVGTPAGTIGACGGRGIFCLGGRAKCGQTMSPAGCFWHLSKGCSAKACAGTAGPTGC